jgi:uncharacterized protein YndB with AHSA1/START domain
MSEQSFTTTIAVERTPAEVFDAITDVRGWWSEEVEGSTDRVGAEFRFRGHDDAETVEHLATIRVVELLPGKRVVWRVVENYFSFVDEQSEWLDTEIRFELSPAPDGGTELRFTHAGLRPALECYDVCSSAWSLYLRDSLPGFILTGQGSPIRRTANSPAELPVG